MIHNQEFIIRKSDIANPQSLPELIETLVSGDVLRWYVSKVTADELVVEATLYSEHLADPPESVLGQFYPGKSAVLNIVPTGVGCDIGGYAGDAGPATALLASCCDYLVTNPNAVNASNFILMDKNLVYTEGYCIDLFSRGLINLHLPYSNKIGLIIEKTDAEHLDVVFNILNTVRAVYGVNIEEFVITDEAIGGRCIQHSSGSYVGSIDNPATLFRACEQLIAKGVTAIAVTSNIQDLPADSYAEHFSGRHPNPVGGAEAIISHLIAKKYRLPAAHAPMINLKQIDLEDPIVDARGAGEITSHSGMASVLIGLAQAPQITARPTCRIADTININNVVAVVTPASALGGIPVLYAQKFNIPVIAVHNNATILEITPDRFPLNTVIEVQNYAEAAGIIMALKRGLNLKSILRPLETLRYQRQAVATTVVNDAMIAELA
ncbi:MAG TPA: DUF3326 domain-containing protein [Herpetosiphon sp.]|uniref:DUF3326 domain-containing protein n=1 Tax=Herpetosiphon aurantiacus (strain ATCC 23779 / DSM 785 / 114-95) TaxID=316274 RepID=A9AUJ6_HERA2|nr:DUF3326 domain-containing protein [Herpetosiphon sp.]ABX04523.1 hypothetical protein Haur_1880 [Herpetosiphon aurantiacus DSM 785]HBW49878.1 DUF3326 domain-containing protein [Herpetosiphon sp.]